MHVYSVPICVFKARSCVYSITMILESWIIGVENINDIFFEVEWKTPRLPFNDEGHSTKSSQEHQNIEEICKKYVGTEFIRPFHNLNHLKVFWIISNAAATLFKPFPKKAMDAFRELRCMLLQCCSLTITMLNHSINMDDQSKCVSLLKHLQHPDGGFAMGTGLSQNPLSTGFGMCVPFETGDALEFIKRGKLRDFILRCQGTLGSEGMFKSDPAGEQEVRSVYTLLAASVILNLWRPEELKILFGNTPKAVSRCQNFQGGFGSCPQTEAHGSETFFAVWTLKFLRKLNSHHCDLQQLLRFLVQSQLSFEGGFAGRYNKLVDSCYTIFYASCLYLVQKALSEEDSLEEQCFPRDGGPLSNVDGAAEYILHCAQQGFHGMSDRPGTAPDSYHTYFCLLGLSMTLSHLRSELDLEDLAEVDAGYLVPKKVTYRLRRYFEHLGTANGTVF